MPYRKKNSVAVPKAKTRIAGMKSIDPALDLGGDMTIAAYEAAIADTDRKHEAYNTAITTITETYEAMMEAEANLFEMSERMLSAVAGRYGKRSREYGMAGGTRRSSTRRSSKSKQNGDDTEF